MRHDEVMTTGIDYHAIVHETLRGVIPRVLERIAAEGLPGEHHLFISFRTDHEGATVPSFLRAQYPDKMTIVLQHQFQNLLVDDVGFGVRLSFGGRPTDLYVPYEAVTVFVDPSVEFALQFDLAENDASQASKAKGSVEDAERESKGTEEETQKEGEVVRVDFTKKR